MVGGREVRRKEEGKGRKGREGTRDGRRTEMRRDTGEEGKK